MNDPQPIHQLPTQQRRILELVEEYQRVTGDGCPAPIIARRLRIHRTTVEDHFNALHRKGWLRHSSSPAFLRRSHAK